jgi:AraC family transcriptional regulator
VDVALLPTFQTYGRAIAQRDFGGLAVSVGVHASREEIPAHRHEDEFQWCLTLDGGFEETAGRRREESRAGSLLIRPPDCVHADRFHVRQGVCLNLFPQRAWLMAHGFAALADTYDHQRSRRLFACGRALAFELTRNDAAAPLAVESLAVEMLASACRLADFKAMGHAPWLAVALDEIEAHPAGQLRLGELAKTAGVSAGHLARAFRARFGKSIGAYVRERRLERAAAMIRDSRLSLVEIAGAVGFYDQPHFSRAFKARFGTSPAAYRGSGRRAD